MDKKKLHHIYKLIKEVSYIPLIAAMVTFGALATVALRGNNQTMIRLRSAVFTADEKGTDIETPLKNLREYVYGHMNTNLSSGPNPVKPPIQLKYTYDRLMAAENERVSAAMSQVYVDAQVDCERRFPSGFSGSNRLPCIKEYVDSHTVTAKVIPEELYKFDFASPTWSPDLAGWSIVLSMLFAIAIAIKFIASQFIVHELKKHHH